MKRCKQCQRILGNPPICFYCKDLEEGRRYRPQSIRYRNESMHKIISMKD